MQNIQHQQQTIQVYRSQQHYLHNIQPFDHTQSYTNYHTVSAILVSESKRYEKNYESKAQKRKIKKEEEAETISNINGIARHFLSQKEKDQNQMEMISHIKNEIKNSIEQLEEQEMKLDIGDFSKEDFEKLRKSVYKHGDIIIEDYQRLKLQNLSIQEIFTKLLNIVQYL